MAKPFLSVIIPAYNEAERLPLTLIDIDHHLSTQDYSYEILVIDDGSTDNTSEIVGHFISVIKDLKIINNTGNRGKGAAVKIGMLAARGNWRLMMDADNAISVREFNKMMPYFSPEHNMQIVIASRSVKGAVIDPPLPLVRRIFERLINRFIRTIAKSKIKDFQIGFQCFGEEAAEKIFSLTKLVSWSYAPEALLLGERLGFRVEEIPVLGSHLDGSHFKLRNYLQILWETIKIRWWLKRNKYHLKS